MSQQEEGAAFPGTFPCGRPTPEESPIERGGGLFLPFGWSFGCTASRPFPLGAGGREAEAIGGGPLPWWEEDSGFPFAPFLFFGRREIDKASS